MLDYLSDRERGHLWKKIQYTYKQTIYILYTLQNEAPVSNKKQNIPFWLVWTSLTLFRTAPTLAFHTSTTKLGGEFPVRMLQN